MKATELARLLPLLVPALSETKGWHWQGGGWDLTAGRESGSAHPSRRASWRRS